MKDKNLAFFSYQFAFLPSAGGGAWACWDKSIHIFFVHRMDLICRSQKVLDLSSDSQ
jgi:hypothetical protein